jgi:glutamate N-acetyltransferase/amino-acid N-acetyltransferase
MCELAAEGVGCAPNEMLVCSTGLIGIPLPIARIEASAAALVAARHAGGGADAARAIMTTDTRAKEVVVARSGFTVGGMAKGAAMLAPNMATMLAVLTSDAVAPPDVLQAALRAAVAASFNTLSVDGCTSTNDTVIVLANGRSSAGAVSSDELCGALTEACLSLARQMAGDAEGATKVVTVRVTEAASDAEAAVAARQVAQSQLVKCSFYGEDPYWGRVVSELGSAGVAFDADRVSVAYGGVTVADRGVACAHDAGAVAAHLSQPQVEVTASLGVGSGSAVVLTNDLTHAYIDENMRTS